MSISLDKATLSAALLGYQQQRDQIDAKMAEIRRMLGGGTPAAVKSAPKSTGRKQKRQMSEEGRARIAAAQRARWAKVKKAQ